MEVTGLSGLESSVVSHSLKGQPIHFLDGLADFTELLANERISQLNGGKRPLGWLDFRQTGTDSGTEFPVTPGSRNFGTPGPLGLARRSNPLDKQGSLLGDARIPG